MKPKTYKFSTFQELIDRVPSDRIALCLSELGTAFQAAKASAELIYKTAEHLAKENGKTLPPMPERLLDMPAEIEWIDDDKGEVEASLIMPDGSEFFSVKTS